MAESKATKEPGLAPGSIIVDLGSKAPKDIAELRKGRGKLAEEVNDAVEELKRAGHLPDSASAHPVIVIVKEVRTRLH
jgi:hypothetical protein